MNSRHFPRIALILLSACGSSTTDAPTTIASINSTAASGSGGAAAASGSGGMSASNGSGGSAPVVPGNLADDFTATELLGRPTLTTIAVSVLPKAPVEVYFEAGKSAGDFATTTAPAMGATGIPLVATLEGLSANTAYVYRMRWRRSGENGFHAGPERSFHTARAEGATFRFTLQADSHLDENSLLEQYHRTLGNVLADAPDFHIDLGDTFMTEKHDEPFSAVVKAAADAPTVQKRYVFERDHFGLIGHSVPLFLVNGNHDGELGYLFTGSGSDLATWTTQARQAYYLNPTPNAFYRGDSMKEPVVGERAAWYAFTWGDALFVALDPFWNTKKKAGMDPWTMTLGKPQYDFLAETLATSTAKHKFVFLHNLVGGLDGQQRGGVEAAPFYEWGGLNGDATPGFAAKRSGWAKPIHELLVEHKVTAVFHGHDHLYAHQEKDGVVYQEVPQPSAKNTQNGATLAAAYHYSSGTTLSSAGHVRVTVSPDGVTSEYVRAWLPMNENATQKNGQVAHTWTKP